MRMLPFFKPKKGFMIAGGGLDTGGSGGGGSSDTYTRYDLSNYAINISGQTTIDTGCLGFDGVSGYLKLRFDNTVYTYPIPYVFQGGRESACAYISSNEDKLVLDMLISGYTFLGGELIIKNLVKTS